MQAERLIFYGPCLFPALSILQSDLLFKLQLFLFGILNYMGVQLIRPHRLDEGCRPSLQAELDLQTSPVCHIWHVRIVWPGCCMQHSPWIGAGFSPMHCIEHTGPVQSKIHRKYCWPDAKALWVESWHPCCVMSVEMLCPDNTQNILHETSEF